MCEKIKDFGQKIGGAKKDLYQAAKEWAEKFVTASTVETLINAKSLGALVKLPNLESLTAAGAISAAHACAILTHWRMIDRKPSASSYRVKRWAEKTAPRLQMISAYLQGATIDEETQEMPEYRVLMAANWPVSSFSFGRYSVRNYSRSFITRKTDPLRIVGGGYYKGTESNDPTDIVRQLNEMTAADSKKRAEGPNLEAYQNRFGQWYVAPDGRKEICIKVLPDGITHTEIRRILAEEREDLIASYNALKKLPDLRRDWNRPRIGKDWRKGADITPETFANVLPFRGVEFGNWVTQTERAALLNSAFDGFHDLAQILGISPDAVTLSGSLAFAFASRGSGSAMAHYESDKRVINLTKKNGAGCMAHEWFHAVDNYAQHFQGAAGFATESHASDASSVAGYALYGAIKNTEFFKRSANYADVKGEYWTRARELAARGFEGVVAYLLKRAGICSDFLVNCLTMDEFTKLDAMKRSDHYPYPTEQEAASLVPYYFAFLRTIFGSDACQIDDATAQEIEAHTLVAEREKEEAKARRTEEAEMQREARAAVAAHDAERNKELVTEKAKAVAQEIGATWHYVFPVGNKFYAIGANSDVVFLVYSKTYTAFRILKENNRLKKMYRGAHRVYLEMKKDINLCEVMDKATKSGFCYDNKEFYDLFKNSSISTFSEFCEKYGKEIETAREERQKLAQDARKEESRAKHQPKGEKPSESEKQAEEEAPHDSLTLEEMDGGVFVSGSTRATYYNRKQIKAHGGTWNKEAQRWEATDSEAVDRLRQWFSMRGEAA